MPNDWDNEISDLTYWWWWPFIPDVIFDAGVDIPLHWPMLMMMILTDDWPVISRWCPDLGNTETVTVLIFDDDDDDVCDNDDKLMYYSWPIDPDDVMLHW